MDRQKHHRRWGSLAAGFLVLGAVGGLGLGGRALLPYLSRVREQAPVSEPPPRAATPAAFVLVTFISRPADARILDARSNRYLGKTPATLPVNEGQARTRFRFEKEGFLPVTVEAVPDADKTLEVVLRPRAAAGQKAGRNGNGKNGKAAEASTLPGPEAARRRMPRRLEAKSANPTPAPPELTQARAMAAEPAPAPPSSIPAPVASAPVAPSRAVPAAAPQPAEPAAE